MAKKASAVVVHFKGGTREYSAEVHGKNYRKLAEEFCAKRGGTIEGEDE